MHIRDTHRFRHTCMHIPAAGRLHNVLPFKQNRQYLVTFLVSQREAHAEMLRDYDLPMTFLSPKSLIVKTGKVDGSLTYPPRVQIAARKNPCIWLGATLPGIRNHTYLRDLASQASSGQPVSATNRVLSRGLQRKYRHGGCACSLQTTTADAGTAFLPR